MPTQFLASFLAWLASLSRPQDHDIIIIITGIDCLLGTPSYANEEAKGKLALLRVQAQSRSDWLIEQQGLPGEPENPALMEEVHEWLVNLQLAVVSACEWATSFESNCPEIP